MNEEEMVKKSLKKLANNIFSKLDDVEKTYLLMVNNEKNKQINELQQELQRKDNEIKQLREDIVNHTKIASEYKEQMIIKNNIIKDAKEVLLTTNNVEKALNILDKMKELEERK